MLAGVERCEHKGARVGGASWARGAAQEPAGHHAASQLAGANAPRLPGSAVVRCSDPPAGTSRVLIDLMEGALCLHFYSSEH